MARSNATIRPESWLTPRARRDATYRHMSHGPILPMEEPSFIERLFSRR